MGNLVVKDNALIEASHRLGEVEQRLVLLAILKAREYCDSVQELKGKELIIHADDYVRTFGINRQMAYKALKRAVLGLFEAKWGYKYINDKGNKVVRYERFTQSAQYVEGEGVVSFKFADAIIPMLIELERRFTSYEIKQVAQLSSQYAMRLYEFCIQHLDKKTGTGWLDISLDELRFRFGLLPTEYERMDNFKRKILDYSIDDLNKNTDLTISYTQKKQGRTIVGFEFEFKQKANTKPKKTKENTDRDPNTLDIFDNLTDAEREIVAQKNAYADQIGANELHRQNLVSKGLEAHREAERATKEHKEREKAKRQAQELAQKQQLELAQRQYEQILAKDELILAYMYHNNLNTKTLRGIDLMYYEQGNLKGIFEHQRYNFENLNFHKHLKLGFLD